MPPEPSETADFDGSGGGIATEDDADLPPHAPALLISNEHNNTNALPIWVMFAMVSLCTAAIQTSSLSGSKVQDDHFCQILPLIYI